MSKDMTRRRLLTAASAVVAVGAVPAIAQAATAPAENPKLLALGAELPKVEKDYHDALAAQQEAWRIWSPQWPLAPEPCCNFDWRGGDQLERNLAGGAITQPGRERPAKVETVRDMEWHIDWFRKIMAKDDKRKVKASKRARARWQSEIDRCELGIALLPGYEAECARIRRESGYAGLDHDRRGRAEALNSFVRKVLMEDSLTMEGVRIKARAAATLGGLHCTDQAYLRIRDSLHDDSVAVMLGRAMLDVA